MKAAVVKFRRGRPRRNPQAVEFVSLRAWRVTHGKFRRVAEALAHRGWRALGVDRTDTVTLASVMDSAADKLLREIEP